MKLIADAKDIALATHLSSKAAEALVETLKQDDPDWDYRVHDLPLNKQAVVKVFDESGEFMGYL
jgi:hypothetical protein